MRYRPPGSLLKTTRAQRGVALITVLALMLLMTVLVLSFFSITQSEQRAAQSFSDAVEADGLAQTAISLAIARLREGMSQQASSGTPLPWTTQPGALRVHEMDGSLRTLYKLYSAETPITHRVESANADVPADWDQRPVEFADLNTPAHTPDPRDTGSTRTATLRFPVVDPRQRAATEQSSVEGFDYGTGAHVPAGVVPPGGEPNAQRLPMPVRWIYALDDGTLGLLNQNGKFTALSGAGSPSKANRVVGRFAFWTDDETCKINVNTASEGVHWDTPRCTTREEMAFGLHQPAAGEFNRFPGHPAMVSLSSVLFPQRRFLGTGSTSAPCANGPAMKPLDASVAERLWLLAPVLNGSTERTSHGGRSTVAGLASCEPFAAVADLTPPANTPADLLWGPSSREAAPAKREIDPIFRQFPEAAARLARGGFFLTAHSEAPELTLFGTPRLSLWPIHESVVPGEGLRGPVARGSAHDYMMALTTTLGPRRYHWQRATPGDGHFNFFSTAAGENHQLFNYARALTSRPVPGFVRPGRPASFAEKFGASAHEDRDSILLGMFDYIRQSNFNEAGLKAEEQFCVTCPASPNRGFGQVSPLFAGGTARTRRTDQLTALDLHAAKGIGRMLTVSEVALLFVCRAEVDAEGIIRGEPSSELARRKLTTPGQREIEMAVVVEGFVPSQGWSEYRPYLALGLGGRPTRETDGVGKMPDLRLFEISFGLLPARTAGANAKPPDYQILRTSDEIASLWPQAGGGAGPRFGSEHNKLSTAFVFQPVVTPRPTGTLEFSGTTGTDELCLALFDLSDVEAPRGESGPANTGDLTQVVPLSIPPLQGRVPCPSLPTDGAAFTLDARLKAAPQGGRLLSSADVVQSLVPAHGDYRLIAAARTLDLPNTAPDGVRGTQVFVPHPLYGRAAQAHALTETVPAAREAVLGLDENARSGYIPGLALAATAAPDFPWQPYRPERERYFDARGVPALLSGAEMVSSGRLDGGRRGVCFPHLTGDFDNGVAWAPDGAYINRPDDGETSGYSIGGTPYFEVAPPQPHQLPEPRPRVWGAQRQLPSPVMLGSLPTGVKARVPWQTLLFRPQGELDPAAWASGTGHYGWSWPRDHLLLDLFWMPVQEPAALSAAFASQGKINLNHRVVPFGYIHRATALHALLKSEKMLAIPDGASETYKLPPGQPPQHDSFRRFIDARETLAQWDQEVFERGDVFLTASQLCEHDLVPEGERGDRAAMREFWTHHRLTGDNAKERPYANLYSRVTTRSNTFRVHFIAESVRLPAPDAQGTTDVNRMAVVARQEGSAVIARTLDPSDPDLPDYAAALAAGTPVPSLDHFYTWRIHATDRFLR